VCAHIRLAHLSHLFGKGYEGSDTHTVVSRQQ